MDHDTRTPLGARRKLSRLAAATIILLTANIATVLVPRAVSAQPLDIASQRTWEH